MLILAFSIYPLLFIVLLIAFNLFWIVNIIESQIMIILLPFLYLIILTYLPLAGLNFLLLSMDYFPFE